MLSQVMHADPPIYHRDIRAPNIMKSFDGEGWFLIDFCDSTTTPAKGVSHLNETEHSPRVRHDNHGPEVDMWGIGKYMELLASRVPSGIAQPQAVVEIARRWMDNMSTNAASALDDIEVGIHHISARVMYYVLTRLTESARAVLCTPPVVRV